ncbi:MAG: FAD-dependent oxidoreductase [Verrucomicrobia bacterium]|nr:FAD-dependent oxidoreductase [Verrucomicrobiota bacterium]MCH8510105.1 FAD-dependent oxidoreductase [Kiritimatiellia bacterium]
MNLNDTSCPPDSACTLPPGSSAPEIRLQTQVCVVGGGMAGLCAALASARMGVKTLLLQDRPVLGGNASSEVRMWICGAHGPHNKETGILEELQLANHFGNETLNYPMWDHVLYGAAHAQDGLDLHLNAAVCEVHMDGPERIRAVRAWHLTRQCWLHVEAEAFLDCSGDSVLRLSGAPCRWGREAKSATGEAQARETADRRTMGNTILIQLRKIDAEDHRPFRVPSWALPVDAQTFPHREANMKPTGHNFWWLELGGMDDTLADADQLRDRLLALAYGVWGYIKNHPDGRGHEWELEWIGSLPGKRENVRYEGDHILAQEDIESGGRFPDIIAHGGWTMDDHPPEGMMHAGTDTTHYPAPSPYGIPYRALYSRVVKNLWFAGRNISATHMAMSSTRVMGTTSTLGQAAGTAAAIAVQKSCDNREVYTHHLERLQRSLLDQDQWLPGCLRPVPRISRPGTATFSASAGDPEVLRSGYDRPLGDDNHRWDAKAGDWVAYAWDAPVEIERVRIIADSRLQDVKRMPCQYPQKSRPLHMPPNLPRDFRIEVEGASGEWTLATRVVDNHRRLIVWKPSEPLQAKGLRLVIERGWDEDPARRISLFAFDVGLPGETGPLEACDWPQARQAKGGLTA